MSRLEKGTIMHLSELDKYERVDLANAIAAALHAELGGSRALIKTVMRWTRASPRAVKQWMAGNVVPGGLHLIALMRHSDAVLRVVLMAAGRLDKNRDGL
jgi:hypothetical protein